MKDDVGTVFIFSYFVVALLTGAMVYDGGGSISSSIFGGLGWMLFLARICADYILLNWK